MIRVDAGSKGSSKDVLAKYMAGLAFKTENAIMAVGQTLLDASLDLVPKDTEYLYQTGRLSQIGSGLDTVAVVGYGGKDFPEKELPAGKDGYYNRGGRMVMYQEKGEMVKRKPSEYAVRNHEDSTLSHDNGQWNFLGEPLTTKIPEMQAAVKNAMG